MKKWKKVLLAAVLLLAVGGYAAFVKISYYPMGGKVTTVDKYQSEMRCIVSAIRVL